MKLAWSNPCFEVWLLLHYDNCTRFWRTPSERVTCCGLTLPTGTRPRSTSTSSATESRMRAEGRIGWTRPRRAIRHPPSDRSSTHFAKRRVRVATDGSGSGDRADLGRPPVAAGPGRR
ncbi:RloB domain-containing protein [Micromonospora rifamycinica]|uniref:RloB domain-containing protein n=1 Tax=Micromonospora rifamycinica TaxID=291594 RepID=UPI003400CF20